MTNYDKDKPQYAFTASTTQFDDQLIQRGIVSHADALVAKGATRSHAEALVEEQEQQQRKEQAETATSGPLHDHDSNDSDSDDDSFLDDEFMQRYRQQRIQELQNSSENHSSPIKAAISSSLVRRITRDDWQQAVNEASYKQWVLVCLTIDTTQFSTSPLEQAVETLATKLSTIHDDESDDDSDNDGTRNTFHKKKKRTPVFVSIPAHEAISNWPLGHLPTIFCYHHGRLQQTLLNTSSGQSSTAQPLVRALLTWHTSAEDLQVVLSEPPHCIL